MRVQRWWLWGLALVSGVLQVLPFPIAGPVPVWRTAFAWLALTPLLLALVGRDDEAALPVRMGLALGYASGFVWYLGNCYWIFQTMHLYGGLAEPVAAGILVLFCLYLGLYHALFAGLVVLLRRSRLGRQGALLLSPFVWVAVELARARITGFPWDLLGNTQIDCPLLLRLAPWTGVFGLSFVVATVNALWLLRLQIRERRHTRLALTLAGVLLVAGYVALLHWWSTPAVAMPTATATLLQENLEVGAENTGPQESKQQMLQSFAYLSEHPAAQFLMGMPEQPGTPAVVMLRRHREADAVVPTDLVVWPESPAPFEESDPEFRTAMSQLARQQQAPVIVGNIGLERTEKNARGYLLYNSASLIAADGHFAARYDKIHLVPFGEYVPFARLFFFAKNLLNEVGTFDPGQRRTVFDLGGHRAGTFICYESVFGNEVRQFVREGAEVLVNISNDGWYGDTSAPWQHLNMVRMRAVENHRWVLRATNTGVTAAIDPWGRVMASAPRHVRTAITAHFGYEHGLTFYTAHGDVFAYLCLLVTVVSVAVGRLRMP
ncbi:MAG: apolipoprotein N-acyltransferase [Acidobacteriota bacterium]|nr:apolipoprotein N-acyltransferase [Acidobacteriota bacterium]